MPLWMRIGLAGLVAAAIVSGAMALEQAPSGRALAFSLVWGAVFGLVLQRGRFCFLCNARDWLERGESGGLVAILIALTVGAVGYTVIFGAWLPSPEQGRLPPTAHIGQVSWALPAAALAFGLGMAVSGSCLSAHLYRLGEGSPTAPFALIGALAGFALGFQTWNPLYVSVVSEGATIWLPHWVGYGGALALTLAALAGLAALVFARDGGSAQATQPHGLNGALRRIFVERWPPAVTGVAVGLIATLAYFRVAPLGVTAELGSVARAASSELGALPETLYGLDTLRGCATAVKTLLLSPNGMFVAGLIGASFAAAVLSGKFEPKAPRLPNVVKGLAGGVLLGWGAMTALGCTIGVLLSGIHAGAASGWVFLIFCFAGVAGGLKLMRAMKWA
ncbi:MAG: YeeE/YedE family protein [Hyphomicrobiales bacterium]|nr:YeeE/YedE family protein [Hyphomicrobiales bacterium]